MQGVPKNELITLRLQVLLRKGSLPNLFQPHVRAHPQRVPYLLATSDTVTTVGGRRELAASMKMVN